METIQIPPLTIMTDVVKALKKGKAAHVELAGPWGTGKTTAAVQAAQAMGRSMLIVAPARLEAEGIYEDLVTLVGEDACALFPAWEVLPTDTMHPADDIVAERMNTLKRLSAAMESGEVLHVVAPVRSLLQRVVRQKDLANDTITLKVGMECDLEDLLDKLIKIGYTRDVMVENRGDVSVRGGIVDVFPISSELPYRFEFFGDELESIRRFEPETQRSFESVEEVQILPRSEKGMISGAKEPANLTSLITYYGKDTLVVFDEPKAIAESVEDLDGQVTDSPYYMHWDECKVDRFARLSLMQVGQDKEEGAARFNETMHSITGWAGHNDDFWDQLKKWELEGYRVQLVCVNTGERRRLYELLEDRGYRLEKDTFVTVGIGRLRAGFTVPKDKLVVLSEQEMFGRHYVRRKRRRFEAGTSVTQFSDLKAGDYIVHAQHGIGRYTGLRRFEGRSGDFMGIQYKGGDTIYVPVTHIDQVQKYVGGDGTMPKVDKVGGKTWTKAKAKVKKAVKDMTEELVKLYAAREQAQGHAFSQDTPWQTEFEDSFQYEETPDQIRAIKDIKHDMERPQPMDRLLCGDVGYGKTEVALRAAFKAVMDGKQVAVLAPTTVLTQQHFATFKERMADFPVRIELINRFRSPKEQREVLVKLKEGEVDILIGTHRLTSKDIHFKNLGLVVVDEEQRFGVAQKERLKQMRTHVDVLTLSATPIPRTLHFSLIGIRDMSVINTAPNDRLPIHTSIQSWDEQVIREALTRELARQGQVFFLHNRVQGIEHVAATINKLVPKARVDIGHGQMEKHQLEEVMTRFINNEVDVLVCTTIIGSGIDIPNANTIIVDRADTFGLSELYQIRGRVGRYKHRAFAYLLVPGDKALSEDAQERLKALEEFSSLGAGFRIAMRDLEIRGAGNLLGGEQSGHIVSVGYETYKDLIAESVAEHRGMPLKKRVLPSFDVSVDAFIPDEYVPTSMEKMSLYRRVGNITSADDLDDLVEELKDRFGTPPAPVTRLIQVMRARALAAELGIQEIAVTKDKLRFVFAGSGGLTSEMQHELRGEYGDDVEIGFSGTMPYLLLYAPDQSPAHAAIAMLEMLVDL